MQDFARWTRAEPAGSFDLLSPADLETLWRDYGGARAELFAAVLSHAQRVGAVSVLAEYRYVDADYRSEHSRFYSTTFRRYPSVAHRLHFFAKPLTDRAVDGTLPNVLHEYGYLGYTTLRPVGASPVGRTMLPPTSDLTAAVSCLATDAVNVFGARLKVVAAPFMAQDAQLGVCVHVTAWVCAYYHHLRFGGRRLLPSDVAGYTPVERGRLVPSSAVTVSQLVTILERSELPPVVYDLARLPSGESVGSIAQRYLDSGMPVIAAGGGHSFVLVGYRWVIDRGRRVVQFIRQDDLCGPYEVVNNVELDQYRPWEYLIIPLPNKVYMSGERAEALGRRKLEAALRESSNEHCSALVARLDITDSVLSYRTSVLPSNEFKSKMSVRAGDISAAYQWLQLSRWVWIVELIETKSWNAGEACVLAEVVVDATGHAEDEQALAWRIPGEIFRPVHDSPLVGRRALDPVGPLISVVQPSAWGTEFL
jgi:hypothetical protein